MQCFLLQVDKSEFIVQEADEPNGVGDLVGPEKSCGFAEIGVVQPINSWELNDRQCQGKIA